MLKRIRVGLAGTNYTPSAIRYAVDIAQRYQATLTGITIVDVAQLHVIQTSDRPLLLCQ